MSWGGLGGRSSSSAVFSKSNSRSPSRTPSDEVCHHCAQDYYDDDGDDYDDQDDDGDENCDDAQSQGGLLAVPFSRERGTSLPGPGASHSSPISLLSGGS